MIWIIYIFIPCYVKYLIFSINVLFCSLKFVLNMTFLCVINFLLFLEILYTSLKCYMHDDDDTVNPDRFTFSCIRKVRAISTLWNYSFLNSFIEFIYYIFISFSLFNWMTWFNCSFYFLKDMIFQNLYFTVSKFTGSVFPLLQNFIAFFLFFIDIQSSTHAVSFTRYALSSIFSLVRLGYRFS